MVLSLIGILVYLAVIISLGLAIHWLIRTVNRRFRLYMNVRRIIWLLAGYGLLLLIATVIAYAVSPEITAELEIPYAELEKEYQAFYQAVHEGDIEAIKAYSNMEKHWEFPYTDKQLTVTNGENEHVAGRILVERKQVNDGLIEASVYRSRSVTTSKGAYTIDFSDEIPLFDLELADGTLSMSKSEKIELTYATFKKEFTINQFTGEGGRGFGSATFWGEHVLYLQIPKDLELDSQYFDVIDVENRQKQVGE